jgi:hypothetical protein
MGRNPHLLASRLLLAPVLAAGLGLMSLQAVSAADPISSAALTRIEQMASQAKNDPSLAEDFGFSSVDEMREATVEAEYHVFTLPQDFWSGAVPSSLNLERTPLYWVVLGVQSDPRVVVTVDTSGATPLAVAVGEVPASQLMQAMTATDGAGFPTYVPEYVSAVVAGSPGHAVVHPLLTQVDVAKTGLQQGATLDEATFAMRVRDRVGHDIKPADPGQGSQSPSPVDVAESFVLPAVVALCLIVGIVSLTTLLVRHRK